ncbi:AraC family transcriptional regulator [Blautia schinkii]|nr:AraC family transcriptional regulator [Blautia schinkii]
MGEITVEEKLNLLAGQMYTAVGAGTWGFGEEGELFYSTAANQDEFLNFFKMGGCFTFAYEKEGGWKVPVILSDSIGLIWIAQHAQVSQGEYRMLVVIGPFFMSSTSLKRIEDELRRKESSVFIRRQMMRVLSDVPVAGSNMLAQYAAMLHYMITGEKLDKSRLVYQEKKCAGEEETREINQPVAFDRKDYNEKLLLKAVKEGNGKLLDSVEADRGMENGLLSGSGDALRDGKNTVIIFEALCCRAAIEGGVSGQIARRMEYEFISEIEKCATITQLVNMNMNIYEKWIETVHEYKRNVDISGTIREACDYIKSNILSELSAEKIAAAMGYTPYYFTKKFHKEMGMRVTDYIKQAKIEYAKLLLLTTKKTIQEISDLLNFGTRSYFSKVFHEQMGVTPAAYRNNLNREVSNEREN